VDFSDYDNQALYNVIDDIPFKFLPCKKELLGGQLNFVCNEKYRKKTRVKGGIPAIVLCNRDMSYFNAINEDPAFKEWAEQNVIFEFINEKFY
jgi:hypothetical protein